MRCMYPAAMVWNLYNKITFYTLQTPSQEGHLPRMVFLRGPSQERVVMETIQRPPLMETHIEGVYFY